MNEHVGMVDMATSGMNGGPDTRVGGNNTDGKQRKKQFKTIHLPESFVKLSRSILQLLYVT
jgi:hypothetical protein